MIIEIVRADGVGVKELADWGGRGLGLIKINHVVIKTIHHNVYQSITLASNSPGMADIKHHLEVAEEKLRTKLRILGRLCGSSRMILDILCSDY